MKNKMDSNKKSEILKRKIFNAIYPDSKINLNPTKKI